MLFSYEFELTFARNCEAFFPSVRDCIKYDGLVEVTWHQKRLQKIPCSSLALVAPVHDDGLTGQLNPLPPASPSWARRRTRLGSCRRVPGQRRVAAVAPTGLLRLVGPVLESKKTDTRSPPTTEAKSQTGLEDPPDSSVSLMMF